MPRFGRLQQFFTALLIFGNIATYIVWADNAVLGTPLTAFPTSNKTNKDIIISETGREESKIFLPVIFSLPKPLPWVDTLDKQAVAQFYLTEYMASNGVDSGWSGSHAACDSGTTTPEFKEAIVNRINFFRAMSGVPPIIGFDDAYNEKAQAAALMMSANQQLNHHPPSTWECYSEAGREAAGSSNLYLGVYGPAAISGYIVDPGSGNYFVGHRRWILYPQTQFMGTGDIPPQSGYFAANDLWVFDLENMWGARPATRELFVAWPPSGYVPRQLLYPRWSFSFADADFSATQVVVTRNGQPVTATISPIGNGFGENTLVWELDELLPAGEVVYAVTLQNVVVNAVAQDFSYQVMVFDPTE